MAQVGIVATGYVYYVSLKGVTGAGHLDTAAVAQMVPRIRRHIRLPVGVGFGIRDAASAQAVARSADAVVIGSALVHMLATQTRENAVSAGARFIGEIRAALDTLTEGNAS
jgi:tryptophan synthase alpha chain